LAAAEEDALVSWARQVAGGKRHGLPNITVEEVGLNVQRQLQTDNCNPNLLHVLSPASWTLFQNCLEDAYKTMDFTVAGMEILQISACWCQHDVKTLVTSYSCCGHSSFKQFCETDCSPDCSSTEATDCFAKCPALCLEPDYAPPDCDCETGCWEYSICIAERSRQQTENGQMSPICDDYSFQNSHAVAKYEQCLNQNPMRTNWHRHNSFRYCACSSGLTDTLKTHDCCGADWATSICDIDCYSEEQCSTTEAQQCLTMCREVCHELHPSRITDECIEGCFRNNSCVKYESCKPMELLSYEYTCPSGGPPGDNGCCPDDTSYLGETCPPLCDIKRNYIVYDELECQCFNCPTDQESRVEALKTQLRDQLDASGQLMMQDVCGMVELETCPTQAMVRMLEERNEELDDLLSEHAGDPDPDLEQKLKLASEKHGSIIRLEAIRVHECENGNEESCTTDSGKGDDDDEEKGANTGVVVAIVVTLVIILLVCAGGTFLFMRKMAGASEAAAAGNPSGLEPRDGDSQVVVGRPVQPGENNVAVGGAPVAPSSKNAEPAPAKGAEP